MKFQSDQRGHRKSKVPTILHRLYNPHFYSIILAWQYELNMMEEEFSAKRPDLGAIEEYKRKESIYLERVAELDEMTKKKEEQRKLHDNLRYVLIS